MTKRDVVIRWLDHAAFRIRLNERLNELLQLFAALLLLLLLYRLARLGLHPAQVVSALVPLFVLAATLLPAYFLWRMALPPDRASAARLIDLRAGLHNELSSALWFCSKPEPTDAFVNQHISRATATVQRLDCTRLVPVTVPRALPLAVVLAGLVSATLLLPAAPATDVAVGNDEAAAGRRNIVVSNTDQDDIDAGVVADEMEARVEAAWLKIERLVSELKSGPDSGEIAEAIAARDARTASRMLAGIRRHETAQPVAGTAARPEGEQMSAALADRIVERVQSLLEDAASWSDGGGAGQSADATERMTQDLVHELREEMSGAESALPGEMSPEEQALNTTLEAMSRESTGGREVVRGEANPMQGLGRTTVGSGAMGRRIGMSSAGAGDGDQPVGDPEGDAPAQDVLGRKTMRLQLQMQTVKIDQKQSVEADGRKEESFYAATQAQAANTAFEDITAEQRGGVERSVGDGELPLAYRDAVKRYTVRQHLREAQADD